MTTKLTIIVTGAGLGGRYCFYSYSKLFFQRSISLTQSFTTGLAAALALTLKGHRVTVYESSPEISEVGAGIQVTPNFTRILSRWRLTTQLGKDAVRPQQLEQLRWKDCSVLTRFNLNMDDRMEKTFGYPYYHIHRADLQKMLYEKGVELGIIVSPGRTVWEYRFEDGKNRVFFEGGDSAEADLVIGADGVRGVMSRYVLGKPVTNLTTGDSAYRALLTAEQMSGPDLQSLGLKGRGTTWMGPEHHIVGYYVCGGSMYNLVILVPDEDGVESWRHLEIC
jgi:salicylate hydroxylase